MSKWQNLLHYEWCHVSPRTEYTIERVENPAISVYNLYNFTAYRIFEK